MRLEPTYPVVTERLRLRPLMLTDAEALHAYRSLPEVCRFIPTEPMTLEAIEQRITREWSGSTLVTEGEGLTLGVELADSKQLIGDVVLFFRSVEHRGGEVGWVFNPRHGRQGYATEAARALLALAFDGLGLHRVIARVDAGNEASRRLCERLGMRLEAHLLQNEWFKGEWSDEMDFALLEHEWPTPA